MSSLPTTAVKGKDSTADNEKKNEEKNLQQQRDLILDLLKHYSISTLDMKYCKHRPREGERENERLFLSFSSQR